MITINFNDITYELMNATDINFRRSELKVGQSVYLPNRTINIIAPPMGMFWICEATYDDLNGEWLYTVMIGKDPVQFTINQVWYIKDTQLLEKKISNLCMV